MLRSIRPGNAALKVACIYALFSLFWISSSDQILFFFVKNSELLTTLQTIKGWLFVIVTSFIVYGLLYREISNVKSATASYLEIEKKHRIMAELTGQLVYDYNIPSKNCNWSGAVHELTGFTCDEFAHTTMQRWAEMIHEDDRQQIATLLEKALQSGHAFKAEYRLRQKDGSYIYIEDTGNFLKNDSGELYRMLGSIKNISDRRLLENQLRHSQKMEAIGTLAGGIAHDFNNILSAIMGYAELSKLECEPDSKVYSNQNRLLAAANRASSLIKQILAFSRQGETVKSVINPEENVREVVQMLRSTLPSTITIREQIDSAITPIFADPTQINQIIMNLATNGFHAMENSGGMLSISLANATLNNKHFSLENVAVTGHFVKLTVSDTGPGIPPEIQERIFDPFFTTKATGKGTGMGLSIVLGIVKSHDGYVSVTSDADKGTSIEIYIPKTEQGDTKFLNKNGEQLRGGTENILLVDDEKELLILSEVLLTRLGYKVTTFSSAPKALHHLRQRHERFDLVITDQTMPELTGAEFVQHVLKIFPKMPIILCTGYSSIISEKQAKQIGVKAFAFKPLTGDRLAHLVRDVLDNRIC